MNYGVKYRLYPNKIQEDLLNHNIEACRILWNELLADYKEKLQNREEGQNIQLLKYTDIKKKPELKEVFENTSSNALSQCHRNLFKTIQLFFQHHKKGHTEFRFPKFKSRYSEIHSMFFQCQNNNIRIEENPFAKNTSKHKMIRFPIIGNIRIIYHKKLSNSAIIKGATIIKHASGHWYVALTIDDPEFHPQLKNDFSHNNEITLRYNKDTIYIDSNGNVPKPANHYYELYEKKIALAQQKKDNMDVESNNFKKQIQKIAKLHEKVANCRKNDLHHYSKEIIENNSKIIVDDINLKEKINNEKTGKRTNDNSFGMLRLMLEYKSKWYNREFEKSNLE